MSWTSGLMLYLLGLGCTTTPETTPRAAWLLRMETLQAGVACASGGVAVHQGWDDGGDGGVPFDGVLQNGEVSQTETICSGTDGDPADPFYGGLVEVVSEPPGPWCEYGGLRIETGVDNGADGGTPGDGVLQEGERSGLDFVCSSQMTVVVDVASTQRPVNSTCHALRGSSTSGAVLETAFEGESFQTPIWLVQPPGDPNHWLVVEQGGKVWAFDVGNPSQTMELVLDLSERVELGYEPGLLSLVFHPNWPDTREVFTYSVSPSEAIDHPAANETSLPFVTVLSRFEIPLGDGFAVDANRETLMLVSPQESEEHNGGWMGFDEAGLLLLSIGDGGGWPPEEAQDLSTWNGKLLRMNIDETDSQRGVYYSIPADNPFATSSVETDGIQPEIVAWGFRNPWRGGIDLTTGEVWLGDVGLVTYEELNRVEFGGDHGWGNFEGDRCRVGQAAWTVGGSDDDCDTTGTVLPEHGYRHALGCSITAGGMVRGSGIEALDDRVIYGDFCQGTVPALTRRQETTTGCWTAGATSQPSPADWTVPFT